MKRRTMWWLVLGVLAAAVVFVDAQTAYASAGSGGGLPYESALGKVKDSMTGPYAFSISVGGIVVGGSLLIFGGDVGGFFRTLFFLVLVIGMMGSAVPVLQALFGQGATIADAAGHVAWIVQFS
jgi:type IV secretion system protein TrbC